MRSDIGFAPLPMTDSRRSPHDIRVVKSASVRLSAGD